MSMDPLAGGAVKPKVRPWVGWWAIGGVLLGLGVAAAFGGFLWFALGFMDVLDDAERYTMPGSVELELETGLQLIVVDSGSIDWLDTMVIGPDGTEVGVVPAEVQAQISTPNETGEISMEFDVSTAGTHTLSSTGDGIIAVIGEDDILGPANRLLYTLPAGAVLVLLGGTTMLITGIRRGRAKRRLQEAAWAQQAGNPTR